MTYRASQTADRMADTVDRSRERDRRVENLRHLRSRADRIVAADTRSPEDAVNLLRFIIIAAVERLRAFGMASVAESLCEAMARRRKPGPCVRFEAAANDGGEA